MPGNARHPFNLADCRFTAQQASDLPQAAPAAAPAVVRLQAPAVVPLQGPAVVPLQAPAVVRLRGPMAVPLQAMPERLGPVAIACGSDRL
jgi:hypothetical protein